MREYAALIVGTLCFLWASIIVTKHTGKTWLVTGLTIIVLEIFIFASTGYSQHEIDIVQHIAILAVGIFAIAMFNISRIYSRLDGIDKRLRDLDKDQQ